MATRKQLALGLRWLVSAGMLTWILTRPALANLGSELRDANMPWLVAGLACAGMSLLLGAKRWQVCLHALDIDSGLGRLFKITLAAAAAGCVSFGSLGVDLAKLMMLGRDHPRRHAGILSSLAMDHTSALPCVATMLIWALATHGMLPKLETAGTWLILTMIIAIPTSVLLARWKFRTLHESALKVFRSRATWVGLITAIGWSIPLWLCYCGIFYCAGRALGLVMPIVGFTGVVAIADGVAALPISIAGLGVREQAFQILLDRWYAIPPTAAVAMSLTGFSLSLIWSAIGAFSIAKFPISSNKPTQS